MAEESVAKRLRTGSMPADLKEKIEKSLALIGEVEAYKKPHRKSAGPVQARVLPAEDLVHDKVQELGMSVSQNLCCASRSTALASHRGVPEGDPQRSGEPCALRLLESNVRGAAHSCGQVGDPRA